MRWVNPIPSTPSVSEGYPITRRITRRYDPAPAREYLAPPRPQRVTRQSFFPPPAPAPLQQDIGGAAGVPGGMGREEVYQPNEAPVMRTNLDRYAPPQFTQDAGGNVVQDRIAAYRNALQGGIGEEQDRITEDQINSISQDEGAQYRHNNNLLQLSREEMQTLPFADAGGNALLPKIADPGPASVLTEDGSSPYRSAGYFMKQPQPEYGTLRRQGLMEEGGRTRTIAQAYEMQQQQQQQTQQQQQSFAPMQPEGAGVFPHTGRAQARRLNKHRGQQQQQRDDDDDEEKPEVHVHISTEKRKEIAKPGKKDEDSTKTKSTT